ncbi:bacteriophage protein [Mycolicibacterium insubricum]|uniref:Gp28/Gp37-like domain-containing protein n=1 Tax=Mycolicibacterium insubricum TaxID=444597 RepID=A0A1X0CSP6_9MYCO|nr:hypothetical protein [Mycolicibacterium insubricum]MCV7081963.1 hypothetical protein [Mycolicibacterium insubricum]ORA63187.1 hypothetical protein BST26_20530 [Mycolicibacterium insubricum]BBZ65825.1 bacteriophage protein [Mycolicibacterium insubricum]
MRQYTAPVDALAKYRLLDGRRELWRRAGKQKPLLRVLDKRLQYLGTLRGQVREGDWERLWDDTGVGKIRIRRDDWLADLMARGTRYVEDLHLAIDLNPNIRSWKTRLGYRIQSVVATKDEDGTYWVDLELVSLREHAKHIALIPTPVSAPEFQPLKAWIWIQNARSGFAFTTFLNLMRTFFPILAIPTSWADPVHWLTSRAGNLSPLHWPIQVQFVNPITDQSRIVPITAKAQMLHDIHAPIGDDTGVGLIDYLWLEEDDTSPHPELAALVGEKLARPSRNCIVLAFEQKDGVTGPTGTAADGALSTIGAVLDDTITEVILPLDQDGDGITDPLFRRLLGVAPEKPSLVWRDCKHSGILTSSHRMQRGTATTVWTGGHSPTILNQTISFVVRYALAQLEQVINYGMGAYQQYGTSGLDNVYQGQADDIFFAWQKFSNPKVALWLNDYAMLDHVESGNGFAWVVSSALTLRQGLHKTSPKVSFTMTARDGCPHVYGFDYVVGDRGMWEVDGIYYVDQIRGTKWSVSEEQPLLPALTIGKERDHDPFESGMKALADGWNAIGSIIGGAAVGA